MNLYCIDCRGQLRPPLYTLNYCNECYRKHIVVSHDALVAQALRQEQQIVELREQRNNTGILIEECRREAKRCGFGLGSDVKETPQEGGDTSEEYCGEGGNLPS